MDTFSHFSVIINYEKNDSVLELHMFYIEQNMGET